MSAIPQTNLEPPTAALDGSPAVAPTKLPLAKTPEGPVSDLPTRPAWVEIDLANLKRNFELIFQSKPAGVQLAAVVKDESYGHGALAVAKTALTCGASFLVLSTVEEAVALRKRGIRARMLLLGDRHESELPWCVAHDLTCCISEPHSAAHLGQAAARAGERVPVHLKLNTGMNRYGVSWNEACPLAELICSTPSLVLEGVLTHFAQSDEADKTFALLQLARFNTTVANLAARGIQVKLRHVCNSGGFLDLPQAHFDMVRLGILPLGVYPSAVCRRLDGIEPVMSVKARVAAIQQLHPGDSVGYGMRYTAPSPRRIAVLPVGYGDGFPRVRNQGFVLLHGQRAPIVGGVAMDAFMVDITDIPATQLWDEAVLMGRQGGEEISVHEVARLKGSVSYDVLTGWRARLPRVYRP
jgi:alanine racemase